MPIDYFVILGLIVVFSFVFFYFGKNKSISVTLSLYLGMLFYEKIPFIEKLILKNKSQIFSSINHWLVYLILSVAFYLLISKHIDSFQSDTSIPKSVIYGLAMTILILSISYFLIPSETIYNFGSQIDHLFVKNIGFYAYILAPIVLLFFI